MSGGGRPGVRRLLGLALVLGVSCQRAAETAGQAGGDPAPAPEAAATVDRVRVFLIAPKDGGRAGRQAACGDSLVPVEVTLPRPAPALEGALRALLAMGDPYDRASGLLDALYASRLEVAGVERQGAQVKVRLTGYVELGDDCDNSRMLAQLTATALQFRGISDARFEVDGQSLQDLLQGKTAPAPPPETAPPLGTGPAPETAPQGTDLAREPDP
ncbi:MAG: GerMN domain-containing protein [Acidobacteria bacterium]|nr:GerMN domain-containing protein [Acidobacteriota bacterium]